MSVRIELPKPKAEPSHMSMHAVVKARDKDNRQWKAVADVVSVSATGSSFTLRRNCEAGTLLQLMIPLEPYLRCYDHDKELYRVWGLVQHCELVSADDDTNFHVGVAFIGKHAPESYRNNSMQHYRISGVDGNGMWCVEEAKTAFRKRSQLRFWKSVNLYLALVDTKDGSIGGERTVAENVSRSGAAVFTTLDVNTGDRVKFISEEYDFSGLAVVCNRETGDDGRTRLHLKFVENVFPVETLMKTDVVVEHA